MTKSLTKGDEKQMKRCFTGAGHSFGVVIPRHMAKLYKNKCSKSIPKKCRLSGNPLAKWQTLAILMYSWQDVVRISLPVDVRNFSLVSHVIMIEWQQTAATVVA